MMSFDQVAIGAWGDGIVRCVKRIANPRARLKALPMGRYCKRAMTLAAAALPSSPRLGWAGPAWLHTWRIYPTTVSLVVWVLFAAAFVFFSCVLGGLGILFIQWVRYGSDGPPD
jgi:hypothetical protein